MIRILCFLLGGLLAGCVPPAGDHSRAGDGHSHGGETHSHGGDESGWGVTAWGEHFEIFAEADALLAGHVSKSHTHVTLLEGFRPMTEGKVAVILRDPQGAESIFEQAAPLRDGIFDVAIEPVQPGDYDLVFRIEAGGLVEDISAGRVRVGDHEGGGLLAEDASARGPAGEAVGFLKEQQWRTPFATAWSESGAVRSTVRGPGRIRPRAGGEVVLSAPQNGLVTGDPWPYPGRAVRRGEAVFRLVPLVSGDRSLAELEATAAGLRAQAGSARDRVSRLEDLLRLEAASPAEVAAARSDLAALEARMAAAEQDLATAGTARRGGADAGESLALEAPFAGRISQVLVTRGEVVTAGQSLGRVIETDPLWVEVALRPGEVPGIEEGAFTLHVLASGSGEGTRIREEQVRFVSRSPEVDPATGTVSLLYEVKESGDRLIPGAAVTVEVGLATEQPGIVIPESAVVDDAGIPVVYVQDSGEEFHRREIRIFARHEDRLLVGDLEPGVRVVTLGGAAIRRAALVSSGEVHGHVH